MNASLAHTIDSLFGPSSELIDVSTFLESSSALSQEEPKDQYYFPEDIVDECSVIHIRESLHNIWCNPTLSAYIIKDHDHTVFALHALNQKSTKPGRKTHLPDPDTLTVEVTNLQKNLDSVSLNSFRLNTDAVLFMRTSKNSDQNILQKLKTIPGSGTVPGIHDAVISISIHNRVSWGPSYATRSSQHAFLSSQSLQDIYNAIPCISNNFPPEAGLSEGRSGCAICIEGIVYGNGGHNDYASKLLKQLESSSRKFTTPIRKAPTSLEGTKLCSLSLCLNEPYWLIHQGNCEHFVVIDQIRLLHPSDPRSGYPLTLQITPPILDLCRACARVPAIWSIVADVRLGESPCVLCGPCWRNMGEYEDGVIVLPIPEYPYDL